MHIFFAQLKFQNVLSQDPVTKHELFLYDKPSFFKEKLGQHWLTGQRKTVL